MSLGVNITIPAFNEEKQLPDTIRRLYPFLEEQLLADWEIVIVSNGSTDGTLRVAEELKQTYPRLRVSRLDQKGRGGALKRAWLESSAEILSYMDADLSTDLRAFCPLIESLTVGGYDLAVGSRLLQPALTTRGFKREVTSRCYNLLVKKLLGTHFSDAQCGFKAITRVTALRILPLVEDNGWFFDTELLVTAERLGCRLYDLPVRWTDGRTSHVNVFRTAMDDLRGLLRLRRKYPQHI